MLLLCALEESNQGRPYAGLANQIIIKTEIYGDKKQAVIALKITVWASVRQCGRKFLMIYLLLREWEKGRGWDWRSPSLL